MKQTIAILGGGMGALTAAFEITSAPDWREHFDVTVYQLGWRLGGKGASGRNTDEHDRIEEHGLHILLGFYENAFRVLRACYDELGRPAGAPLATWQDAFKPHDYVVLMEKIGDRYEPWPMNFPRTDGVPGEGGVLPSPRELLQMVIGWLREMFGRSARLAERRELHDRVLQRLHDALGGEDHDELTGEAHGGVEELHGWLHDRGALADGLGHDLDWRRTFVTLDLGLAAIRGILDSGVLRSRDWFSLDDLDFRAWLTRYGAHDVSVNSAYVQGMYDLGFSGPGQVGAGTALNGILRMCWTYKGAVMWKMQAGMGDTIFAPLYLVLKQRGVRFEFFQRVDELQLSPDRRHVDRIVIGQQVTLKGPAYDPLVEVKGLPCWPSAPRYEQLEEGAQLRESGENLEDWWTAWKDPAPARVLERGADFDLVILGCSVGVFPYIAKELLAASPQLAAMVEKVGTTQTQAAQLWMSKSLSELGWPLPSPVLDGYAEPLDTWADMTHLVPRESWPASATPANIAYMCSSLPDQEPLPPRTDHDYTRRQSRRVKTNTLAWLEKFSSGLWPATERPAGGFDYQVLVAPGASATGPERLDTQYWVATYNPSDRYVLALPGSVGYRLGTRDHGFANLYLAGDYLKTGMNVGCVEAATMGGMHASRSICGRPEEIIGDET